MTRAADWWGRCDTCGRLGRQVGAEESPGGSGGGARDVLWGALKTRNFLFVDVNLSIV